MAILRLSVPVLIFAIHAVVSTGEASAQTPDDTCHAISPTERVVVTLEGGVERRGSLLCVSDTEVFLVGGTGIERQPLDQVRRITTRPDPVWDGAAKGVAVPLIIWALMCRGCEGQGHMVVRSVATYGLIGLTLDAFQSHRRTIYDGGRPAATVSWRVRF